MRSYEPDLIAMRAHALTFRTLLSVIPLLAVAFSLFKAFGGLEASQRLLQQKMLENLAPGTASLVQDYTNTYLTRVSAGAIGANAWALARFSVRCPGFGMPQTTLATGRLQA